MRKGGDWKDYEIKNHGFYLFRNDIETDCLEFLKIEKSVVDMEKKIYFVSR